MDERLKIVSKEKPYTFTNQINPYEIQSIPVFAFTIHQLLRNYAQEIFLL